MPAVLGLISRLLDIQAMFSLLLRRMRLKLTPHDEEAGLNERDWKGIRISAVQPSSSFCALASQMPSQLLSTSMMFWNKPSQRTPFGLTSNR